MKNRSFFSKSGAGLRVAEVGCGLLMAVAALGLTSCHSDAYYAYKFPTYTFANRPVPPSKLANRVMVALTANGTIGSLQILDSLRNIRNNIQNANSSYSISGYAGGFPDKIFNFPEEVHGFVLSDSDGSLASIDYGKESSSGTVATFVPKSSVVGIPQSFSVYAAAVQTAGQLVVIDNASAKTYGLNLPNVYQVAVNPGGTIILAMVRNSDTLYRVLKLNSNQAAPPGAVDCQPQVLPVYCVVPVPDSPKAKTFDRPIGAYFSLDGSTVYVLDCGPECGGTTAGVSVLQTGILNINVIPDTSTYPSPVTASILVPGGATAALSDGTTLYVSGQQLQSDGLFAGVLSTISLASNEVTGTYSISDGNHSKMLFADDNTLWIGSQSCANGERQHQAAIGNKTQAGNYNCLTKFDIGAKTASVVPAVNQNTGATVPYPNSDSNQYYYGSLTGLCWVQNLHKVYTAYGGQVHAFYTGGTITAANDPAVGTTPAAGTEIDNSNFTVQGTALDVAYMDAITDNDN